MLLWLPVEVALQLISYHFTESLWAEAGAGHFDLLGTNIKVRLLRGPVVDREVGN